MRISLIGARSFLALPVQVLMFRGLLQEAHGPNLLVLSLLTC
jgi:hypothetical protein